MVRKGTWILLIILLALVGVSLYLQRQKDTQATETATPNSTPPLFSAEFGAPTALRIENAAGDAVELERDTNSKWVLRSPTEAEADQAAAEAAATQVGALRSLALVNLAPAIIGLDEPAYTVTITFGKAGSHRLLVGSETPVQDGYYCQLDDGAYLVVDRTGLDVLLAMLKTPPYAATLTPVFTATPSSSDTPIPETTPAAAGTASPTP